MSDAEQQDEWIWVGGCTCNAVFCLPGSGHEDYCGWEQT